MGYNNNNTPNLHSTMVLLKFGLNGAGNSVQA